MMRRYTQLVSTIGLDGDGMADIVDKLAEVGSARANRDSIEFTVEAPDDWALALLVADVRDLLATQFSIDFDPDYENVSGEAPDPVSLSTGPWYPRSDDDGDIVDGTGRLIATVYADPTYNRAVERATIIAAVNVAKAGRS